MRALLLTDGASVLAQALATAGLEIERGEEHRLHGGRFDVAIVGPDVERVTRLRRSHHELVVVAWVQAASTELAADLLDGGAHEVLDAAMGSRELHARLRRTLPQTMRPDVVTISGLTVDLASGEATWNGDALGLTRREREVLHALARAHGRTVRRATLYRDVWGYAMARGDRTVDVNVKRVRAKLARAGVDLEIRTEPAVGYRLEQVPVTAL